MAKCSEHFLNGLATIVAVYTSILCNITFYFRVEGQETQLRLRSETYYAFYPFILYPELYKYNIRVSGLNIYTVSQKKLCKIVFARTSSNVHQF